MGEGWRSYGRLSIRLTASQPRQHCDVQDVGPKLGVIVQANTNVCRQGHCRLPQTRSNTLQPCPNIMRPAVIFMSLNTFFFFFLTHMLCINHLLFTTLEQSLE
ncbi:hypothetical protein ILYODFUR_013281 [Ilyodon furcidens]|uniref:Uncharacterized protein n=1 Tax=Ilyodon furcidens TaxID=33524 RepID=A0ABV0SWX0_9TELE